MNKKQKILLTLILFFGINTILWVTFWDSEYLSRINLLTYIGLIIFNIGILIYFRLYEKGIENVDI